MLASRNTITARNARPCAQSVAVEGRARLSIQCAAMPARHVRHAHGPASPPEPRAKPALLTQATVQMAPSTMIPSLLHQKASEEFEFLAAWTGDRLSDAQKLWQARESAAAVVGPATAAEAQAVKVQETNAATECMVRALQHTNTNLSRQLREERAERLLMKVRLERMKAGFSPKSDVSCDPAMERQIQHMIKAQEMQAMEMQLATMRHEMTVLRAQLEACKSASPRA